MEHNDHTRRESIVKLGEMIRDIRIAMLTTRNEDGSLRSRPMAVQEVEFDGDLWFFTNERSPKVYEIESTHEVNVSLSDPKSQRYISLSGTARSLQDHAKMAELWKPAYKAWFPKGLEDPDLSLLQVSVHKAEYWDTPPSMVVHLAGMVKSTFSGRDYDPGDHAKVDLDKGYVS